MDQQDQARLFKEEILPGLPPVMKRLIQDHPFYRDELGCSKAAVLIFDHGLVLKIEKKSPESDGEYQMLCWLNGRLPVPKIRSFHTDGKTNWLLMTRLPGRMLCDPDTLSDPGRTARLLARGLRRLWQVDIAGCPRTVDLRCRLNQARARVEQGVVDVFEAEPETFGPDGFPDPQTLYELLEATRPEEEFSLVHGDYCLPNLFAQGEQITGFLDLGFCGIGDRWQDIALGLRSLRHNLEETGRAGQFADASRIFFETAGIVPDQRKIRYYQLLDELF